MLRYTFVIFSTFKQKLHIDSSIRNLHYQLYISNAVRIHIFSKVYAKEGYRYMDIRLEDI